MESVKKAVSEYYGETLKVSEDLKTNACCTLEAPPQYIQEILTEIHETVQSKYYGCGLTIPTTLGGLRILDLGSGSGRDSFIASKLVGANGAVVGIDMTDSQLKVAKDHIDYHTKQFGYAQPNVQFLKGDIENLSELHFPDQSFDLIISNCVINLVEDKAKVLKEVFRLLKPGGELYFSDVYVDRRLPIELQKDPVLWGECLSGALYWNDFLGLAKKAGFTDPRAVSNKPISIENPAIEEQLKTYSFFSVTYRLFKIEGLESDCEDYGQAVAYKGSIFESPIAFDLDDHHHFPKGKIIPVCGNTYRMLNETRLKNHFDFYGTWDTHFGIFEGCGGAMPFDTEGEQGTASCC